MFALPPTSGHVRCKQECPLSANSGHYALSVNLPADKNPGKLPGASLIESIERDQLLATAACL
jgi:hypothetical protein